MSKHATVSPGEAADRLAIRELVEAYAHCADRRDAKGQMSLFTPDTHFVVYMNAKDPKPSQGPDWQQSARRLVDILITGSRPVK
jgi:ketosteroid isomerase-like protein